MLQCFETADSENYRAVYEFSDKSDIVPMLKIAILFYFLEKRKSYGPAKRGEVTSKFTVFRLEPI
jgi:hypothetical protein